MLFRKEAMDAAAPRLWSDVTLKVAFPVKLAAGALVVSVIGIGAFIATGNYARKEQALGFIAAHDGVANIVAPRPGAISEVFVAEGQIVEKGARLFSVRTEVDALRGGGSASRMLRALRRANVDLDHSIDTIREAAKLKADRLNADIAALQQSVVSLAQQKSLQTQRTAGAQADVDAASGLAQQKLVTQPELNRRRENLIASRQAELQLQQAMDGKTADLAARRNDLAELPLDTQRTLEQLKQTRDENLLKIRQIDAERGYVVVAPKRGQVSALQAWVGKSTEPNSLQMSLVPVDDELTAELFVSPIAIGSVAEGQTVHLALASFPYEKFGYVDGVVRNISYTLLKPDQQVGPVALSAPAYRVSVKLAKSSITAFGREEELRADMQLTAEIVADRRSFVDWLVEPVLATLRRTQ